MFLLLAAKKLIARFWKAETISTLENSFSKTWDLLIMEKLSHQLKVKRGQGEVEDFLTIQFPFISYIDSNSEKGLFDCGSVIVYLTTLSVYQ